MAEAEKTAQDAETQDAETQDAELAGVPEVAHEIINRHALYAAAGGLIPLPLLEVVTSGTIQLRMIAKLCDLYTLPFSEQAVKAAIATLVGSVLPFTVVGRTTFSLFRAVPLVGPALSLATVPAVAGAVTWAVGRVFAWQFQYGGSLENF
ncbi:MAG: hypothetical protein WD100_12690, partial [Tistlia sp.]